MANAKPAFGGGEIKPCPECGQVPLFRQPRVGFKWIEVPDDPAEVEKETIAAIRSFLARA